MEIGTENLREILKEVLEEKLRLELDDLWFEEIKPPAGVDAVVYPNVFQTPEGEVKVIFNDSTRSKLYIADIDEDLQVTNPVTLPFNGYCPSIVYEPNQDNWLVLVFSRVKSARYGLYRLSRDFQSVVASQDPVLVSGVPGAPDPCEWVTGGAGALYVPHDEMLWLLGDFSGYGLEFSGTGLATGDPHETVPTLTWRNIVLQEAREYYNLYGYAFDGVSSIVNMGDMFAWLQNMHGAQHGGFALAFGYWNYPEKKLVGALDYSLLFGSVITGHPWDVGTLIHASLTDVLLKRHLLALLTYTTKRWTKFKSYAFRLPWELFDPKKHTLIWHVWINESIDAGATSPAIPGFGRKTIHFTSDTAGDLDVLLDAIGLGEWKTDTSVPSTTDALVYTDHSGLRLRLKFSAAAKVSAYVVVEP